MVRNYVRKSDRGATYSKENLLYAVEQIKSGSITVNAASEKYAIPRPTLYDHIKGRRGMKSESIGRPTALGTATESKLAGLLKVMNKYGYGLSRKEVLNLVGNYVTSCNIKTPFRNGYPDEDWWLGFSKKQHLNIK